MKWISFGSIYHHTFYPLYASIFCIIRTYSFDYFEKFDCPVLFEVFLMFFGMLLSIFLEMISVFRLYRDNSIKEYCKKLCKQWKYQILIAFLSILDLSEFIGLSILLFDQEEGDNKLLSTTRLIEFFFVSFLNNNFFKHKLHRHHFVPLLLIAIGIIIVIFGQTANIIVNIALLFSIFGNILYAILEIIEKWLMESKYFSPYDLVYLSGLYGCIIMIIIFIIGQ